MPPILTLIDGHALAYRAYFALSASAPDRWKTSSGEPTAGIYGFVSVLLRMLEQDMPEYLAVAFDTGKTFRNEIYSEYKATRNKMPEDLRPQIERLRQFIDSFGIPRLEMEGYEADDVLGTIAAKTASGGAGVRIITGDRDLLQLVNERIIVNLPGKSLSDAKDYTPEDVVEKLGVRPEQVVDYKALMGDPSDNIPGVRGIGKKTARLLLQQYPTLDDIYAHLDEIPTRYRTKLEAGRESAYMSRDLARIRTDLPLEFSLEDSKTDKLDFRAAEAFFRELEFHSLLKRLSRLSSDSVMAAPSGGMQMSLFENAPSPLRLISESSIETHIVDTEKTLRELAQRLESAKEIAFDTETTSTRAMEAELVGISFAVETGKGYYVPIGHRNGIQLPLTRVFEAIRPALTNLEIPKIGHNVKYDFILLARNGIRVTPLSFDTMIAEWLIHPASHTLGLKNLAFARLGEKMIRIEELIGKGKNQRSMAEVSIEAAAPYAAADAEICLRLKPQLEEDLRRVGAARLLQEMEMPLVSVLAEMEMTGILLDAPFFKKMSETLQRRLAALETDVYEMVGGAFNLNSTQQLSKILFERLHLTPPGGTRKTKSGYYSTSASVLESLRGAHPVVDLILEHRELAKLKSTYVDALPAAVNPKTGRIHTSFNQTGSVTGRLASSSPNLQNIPIRTEMGRRIREGFVAAPGNVFVSVDYSQIELRIVAHMAQDEAMLAAFRAGKDIHAATAAAIHNVPLEAVTSDMRRRAKAINFGLIYGMSAFGLTRSTDLTLAEAEDFVKAYFQQFPGVKRYLDSIRREAAERGYVETLLGRRRYFPSLQRPMSQNQRSREERAAINAPIQGTAADIMKLAMLKIPPALQKAKLHGKMLIQVHDEVVMECPEEELATTVHVVKQTMESAYQLSIPLLTDAKWGKNWGTMQPYEE